MIVLRNAFDKLKSGIKKLGHHVMAGISRFFKNLPNNIHKLILHRGEKEKLFSELSSEEKEDIYRKVYDFEENNENYKILKSLVKEYWKRLGPIENDPKLMKVLYENCPTLLHLVHWQTIEEYVCDFYQNSGEKYSEILFMYGGTLVFLYDFDKNFWSVQDWTYNPKKEWTFDSKLLFKIIARYFDPEHDAVYKHFLDSCSEKTRQLLIEESEYWKKKLENINL